MIKFRVQTPYNNKGQTNFRYTDKKSGVYLIYKNGVLRYVGMSGYNVYKTMYRHFQSWKDETQVRTSYRNLKGFSCRVVLCSKSQAQKLEKMLILKYKPTDNPEKYLKFAPKQADNKIIRDFIGTKAETCPF